MYIPPYAYVHSLQYTYVDLIVCIVLVSLPAGDSRTLVEESRDAGERLP